MRLRKKPCQCCVGIALRNCLRTLFFLSLAISKFGGNLGQNSLPKLSQSAIRQNTDPVSRATSNDGQYSWPLHRKPIMVNEQYFRRGTCTLAALRFPFRLGTLRSNDADDNENVKKTIGLISKTTTSHVQHTSFLFCFCTTTTRKCLISRFMEDVNKQRRNFISLSELEFGPLKFSFRRVRL